MASEPQSVSSEKVLIVDDEADLRNVLLFKFREAGFEVDAAATAVEGLAAARRSAPDVVVLDVMLPDLPGTEVCKRLRADASLGRVGILILTAKGEEVDRVVGLEIGADDYVVKPFSVRELVARVRTLARRVRERGVVESSAVAGKSETPLTWRGLEFFPAAHRVLGGGQEIPLTPVEFKLLELLLANPERAFTREHLLASVWCISADVTTRTVDTHVKRLREKLGDHGEAIETVRGVGYRLRPP